MTFGSFLVVDRDAVPVHLTISQSPITLWKSFGHIQDCIWTFAVAYFVGLEGMDPCTDRCFDHSLRVVLDKAMFSRECLLGGCTDGMVVLCTLWGRGLC